MNHKGRKIIYVNDIHIASGSYPLTISFVAVDFFSVVVVMMPYSAHREVDCKKWSELGGAILYCVNNAAKSSPRHNSVHVLGRVPLYVPHGIVKVCV